MLTIIANFSVRMFLSGVSHQQQQTCFDMNMPGAEGLMVDGNTSSSAQLQGTQGDWCCLLSVLRYAGLCLSALPMNGITGSVMFLHDHIHCTHRDHVSCHPITIQMFVQSIRY